MLNDNTAFTGVTVFGSAIIRVQPDTATVLAAVSRIDKKAEAAFTSCRSASISVQKVLNTKHFGEFGVMRASLSQEYEFKTGVRNFVGYKARIGYSITIRELDRLEELLTEIIAAGANELVSVSFETKRLKELRADARRQSVAAAREKAELYCREAGVVLGSVIGIRDNNPDLLRGVESHMRSSIGELHEKPIDPAMIDVSASVYLTFTISAS